MKKMKKFADLNLSQACAKQSELLKELVAFQVSMDPSVIKSAGNVVALKRDLKVVSRRKAILSHEAQRIGEKV